MHSLDSFSGMPLKEADLSGELSETIDVFGVSPNGEWFAYASSPKTNNEPMNLNKSSIVLMGANGKKITHALDLTWLESINRPGYQLEKFVWGYWINNELIFTLINSKIPGDPYGVGLYYMGVFDPFRGTWRTDLFDRLPMQTGLFGAAFSPDLGNVLYDDQGITLIGEDSRGKQNLWRDEHGEFSSKLAARWSPDSSWVVFANREGMSPDPTRLYLISKDGKAVYKIKNQAVGVFFKNFYWSSDGRYFAYVADNYSVEAPEEYNLLIFDIHQRAFILRCPIDFGDLPYAELTWSPDDSWIAISQKGGSLRLLNIASGKLFDLNIKGVVVGWSDQFLKSTQRQ